MWHAERDAGAKVRFATLVKVLLAALAETRRDRHDDLESADAKVLSRAETEPLLGSRLSIREMERSYEAQRWW